LNIVREELCFAEPAEHGRESAVANRVACLPR
jgi:hypothetical protein